MHDAPKPHFSGSQLNMHAMCPEGYRRRYMEKEIIPPGIFALRGTGMHRGASANMKQKIESGRDLPAREIIDAGIAAFEDEARGGVMLTSDEAAIGAAKLLGDTKDDLVAILDVHARQQAPDYQPILVEEPIRIPLDAPRDLLGVLDLATERGVVDFKTAKRSKSQGEADSSVQLTIYAACFTKRQGHRPDFVQLDTIVQSKTKTARQVLPSDRDDRDFAALAARINAVQKAIDAGVFTPAAPGAWNCSEKYCGYYRTCPFVNGGRASQGD